MNLIEYIHKQMSWSLNTFGKGNRVLGITKHIEKEIDEVRSNPKDLSEWADIAILALDGAWRAGYSPEEIAAELERKQGVNFQRKWPKGRDDEPIEHIRESDHTCKQDKTCICGALADEPREDCPVHGCQYPPRCACGKFVKIRNDE